MTIPPAPPRGFDTAEFARRIDRAQRLMRAHNFDGLVLTTPHNIRWATGFDSQFWESPTRPWFITLPADGAPIAVVPEIGAPQFTETWLDDIRTWPSPRPEDDGASLLADVLNTLPRSSGRIGFELGREMALRMPVTQFLDLRDRLPGVELADGAEVIWAIRMVKTEAEITHIRHICQIASAAYARVPDLVRPGMTEREAARALRIELAQQGADSTPFLPAISGPGGVPQIVCGPGDRVLRDGDVLFFDTGSTFDGYWCDFDRNYAVGALPDAARRTQDAMWRATDAGIAAARPGATAEDLFHAMAAIIQEVGPTDNNVGRLGHGLGMQLTEPPSHMFGDRTVIEEGMVLTIEPGVEYTPGKMIVHEENIVIRADGAELLTTRAPREMLIIQ
ncbi:MAG: Xaa-Pro peptidase family protein [Rhodobacteraceae bacterium]|nr:Xaa-Pro peptidase family protein [Paracoccaceae bacterium]